MATRKTVAKQARGRSKGKTEAELRRLLRKARTEVEQLLKADRAGTLTRKAIHARLTEVDKYLEEMGPLEHGW